MATHGLARNLILDRVTFNAYPPRGGHELQASSKPTLVKPHYYRVLNKLLSLRGKGCHEPPPSSRPSFPRKRESIFKMHECKMDSRFRGNDGHPSLRRSLSHKTR